MELEEIKQRHRQAVDNLSTMPLVPYEAGEAVHTRNHLPLTKQESSFVRKSHSVTRGLNQALDFLRCHRRKITQKTYNRRLAVSFTELPIPTALKLSHELNDGKQLRRWVKALDNGEYLRVMAGREPCADDGGIAWHVSVSVAKSDRADSPPIRIPEDSETEDALTLVQTDQPWKEYHKTIGLVRHFFDA